MKEQSDYFTQQKNFLRHFVILFLIPFQGWADGFSFPIGSRSWGLANATVAFSDCYAIGNNVAGLAGIKNAAFFSTYDSHYGFDGINTLGFGAVAPFSENLGGGMAIQRFGDKVFNQTSVGIGAGHLIGRFRLGLKMNYLQTAIHSDVVTLSKKAVAFELGGIVMLSSKLFLGAHMFNLTQSRYTGHDREPVDTSLKTGLFYKPSAKLRLSGELEKISAYPISFRAGIEYEIIKKVVLRTGIATQPQTSHFGFGFQGTKLQIDYAVSTHPQLGWSHHFTLTYALVKSDGDKKL